MIGNNHNQPAWSRRRGHLVRWLITLSAACLALCGAPVASALDTGDIVVTSLKGEVHVTMSGAERPVRVGTVLELPATVRTGAAGAIEIRQGATTVGIGPDTLLEFPALEQAGGSIDRIVQPRGNAFYSIGKRAGHKLRVETPYLVGVVKGTQFNIVAQEASTTISLFEGLLEVRSADGSDVIDLHAGEIAARARNDTDINVMKMRPTSLPPAPAPIPAPRPPGMDKGADSGAPQAPAHPLPAQPDDGVDAEPLLAERDVSDLRPIAITAPVFGPPLVNAPAVVEVPPVELIPVTPEVDPATPVAPVTSIPEVVDDANGEPHVNIPNVDPGGNVSAGGTDNLNANLGIGNEDSDSQGSNGGNVGNNGHSGQGNNGNGQGNDGTGPGNNGQGNNSKDDDLIDNVTALLDGLRGKHGKK